MAIVFLQRAQINFNIHVSRRSDVLKDNILAAVRQKYHHNWTESLQ